MNLRRVLVRPRLLELLKKVPQKETTDDVSILGMYINLQKKNYLQLNLRD